MATAGMSARGKDNWRLTAVGATPSVSKAAQTGIRHFIEFMVLRGHTSGQTWTFKNDSVTEIVGDIGDETLVEKVILAGSTGKAISLEMSDTNGNSRIYMSGYSVKVI